MQCSVFEMFIPDPNFFHPGSRVIKIPDPGSASSILTKKFVSKLSELDPACSFSDPDLDFLPIPDPGVNKAPDPGSGSATLTSCKNVVRFQNSFKKSDGS